MNNDARFFLDRMIDSMPADFFEIPLADAREILDTLPECTFRDLLRDAFRDNIDCPEGESII